jgi:hypothetical protein
MFNLENGRNLLERIRLDETRREFLGRAAQGIGAMALAGLLTRGTLDFANAEDGSEPRPAKQRGASASPDDRWEGVVRPTHYTPRAKRIIYLYMAGGPSQVESFDPKPRLVDMHGQPMPQSVTKGAQMSTMTSGQKLKVLRPQYEFQRYGEAGIPISDLFPHIGQIADEITVVRSMQTEQINHDPAHTFMNTGFRLSGRPSMGAWVTYGLGSESENLPGFVVMTSKGGGQSQPIAARQWHSGFLPGRFQGVKFQSHGEPVNYVRSPQGVSPEDQRAILDAVKQMNHMKNEVVEDPEIATRISQYEMAFRMQASVPELASIEDEPDYIKDMYGVERLDGSFAANCLMARRLAERGTRFIQLYHRGWDHHGNLKDGLKEAAELVDRPSAALVKDLKQRGMLEDTLVIWGGEFGRTPMGQGEDGRDHHINAFSLWMAGGGVRGGHIHGTTDDFGFNVVEDPVHVHDLHATILYLLGIDHKRLTYTHKGREFRLTDVHGHVVDDIIAA